ncbi:hypothetical protein GQ55_9G384500 [Panicum hallii var. hallii]|uniref:Uncharacterized protein n=1 Tax=Panicum hallii var. hallii TaxID=1504633 RepID=A0A2T7C9D3_9POAL|nr:hypothetical protein GQ55_9G384500 [Panicum hallii var. hallii]
MEGWTSRRKHRNGGFWLRAEIEVDRGSSIPRGPEFGFAAAVREPLVKLRRPEHDFERWDWDYFVWPHDRLDANLEMRDSDPEATLEADRKASVSFLNKSTLQLESYEMYQYLLQQHASAWPCNRLKTNLEMRDSSIEATLEADGELSESSLNQSTLQPENEEMYQHTQEQHTAALPRDHLVANLEMRNTDAEAKLKTDRKAKERSTRRLKRSEMDRRTQEQHKEKENEQTELFRTPTPVNKKAVGPRSARRRRVFAEANLSPDDDRARQRQVPWAC